MNFKKLLCMSLAVLSVFFSAVSVGAQEAEETATEATIEKTVLAEDAELMAITNATIKGITYELNYVNKNNATATIIGISDEAIETKNGHNMLSIGATVTYSSKTYNITAIADGAGSGLQTITYLNLNSAKHLVSIGENCFSYCPNLTIFVLPKLNGSVLESIGNNAFYYCPALTTGYYYDATLQPKLNSIGSSVFGLSPFMEAQTDEFVIIGNVLVKYNGTDTDITLPTGTVGIADAFFGKDITSIDLGNKLVTIGNNAFYGCRSLESISIPASCTTIGDMAFAGCTSLKTVEYAGGLTSIGFCSFANCPYLVRFLNTGSKASKLTDIGECAFWNDVRLHYLDAGEIVNVNVGSFWNCFGQTPDEVGAIYYYRIPETVKTIAEGGYGNLEFAIVTVPDSLTAIASTAFGSTSSYATYVVSKGSTADSFFSDSGYRYIFYGDMDSNGKIQSKDIKTIADYIAKGINDLNYNFGRGVIADGNSDNNITMRDLFDVLQSIKPEYEAEQAAAAE